GTLGRFLAAGHRQGMGECGVDGEGGQGSRSNPRSGRLQTMRRRSAQETCSIQEIIALLAFLPWIALRNCSHCLMAQYRDTVLSAGIGKENVAMLLIQFAAS